MHLAEARFTSPPSLLPYPHSLSRATHGPTTLKNWYILHGSSKINEKYTKGYLGQVSCIWDDLCRSMTIYDDLCPGFPYIPFIWPWYVHICTYQGHINCEPPQNVFSTLLSQEQCLNLKVGCCRPNVKRSNRSPRKQGRSISVLHCTETFKWLGFNCSGRIGNRGLRGNSPTYWSGNRPEPFALASGCTRNTIPYIV